MPNESVCQLVGEKEPWSVLGQSYGGFCAVHYLSAFPHGLREVFVTGGLPPLAGSPDEYYRHTYPEVERKTRNFFARYPGDRDLCVRIMEHLHRHEVAMPTGGPAHGSSLSAGRLHARVRRWNGESPLPARERVLSSAWTATS